MAALSVEPNAEPIESTWVTEDEGEITGGAREEEFGYCYYRRADGSIGTAKADEVNQKHYREKGFTPLLQYGRFVNFPRLRKDSYGSIVAQWDPRKEPYGQILLSPGGPEEFSIDQIHELGWNRRCTAHRYETLADGRVRVSLVRVNFPQLRGVKLLDYQCEFCAATPFATKGGHDIHVRVHHPEQASLFALAQTQTAMAEAIHGMRAGEVGGEDKFARVLEMLVAQQEAQQQRIDDLIRVLASGAAQDSRPKRPRSAKQLAYSERLKAAAAGRRAEKE